MSPGSHPVTELLLARAEEGSRPGGRSDPYKLGLALEGGCMRGVVSAGMACALERLGFLEAFDAVYGASAGAINGAFFVAGQTVYATPIYWEDINNRRFINYLRLLSRSPVVSLEYLLDHVMRREKILDWKAVIDSPVPLKPVVVSLDPLEALPLGDLRSQEEVFDALRASSSIPIVAGPPAEIAGRRYIDGGAIEPLSFKTAVRDGCTHVLVLPTLPAGRVRFRNPILTDPIVLSALERLHPGLAKSYRLRRKSYLHDYQRLGKATARPKGPPFLFAVRADADAGRVHWFERRRETLIAGAVAGMESTFRALLGVPRKDLWPSSWANA